MKICTITRHNVYNYGATLQAYALQEYLKSLGNDVKIIDYRPVYDIGHYGFHWYVFPLSPHYNRCKKNPLFRLAYCFRRGIRSYKTIKRKWKFDEFDKEYLDRTKIYKSYDDLLLDPPSADTFIAGSDQIWYAYSLEGQDKAYYLEFVKSGRKISYAASFGTSTPNPDFEEQQKHLVSKFDYVTVREEVGKKILSVWDIPSSQVCDPVFLLHKEDWIKLSDRADIGIPDKYILIYNLGPENSKIREIGQQIAKEHDFKIISINSPGKIAYSDKKLGNIGPKEFVKLIAHAQVVLTNSFHGTAFSIILNKPFYAFAPHSAASAIRIKDLLSKSGLDNRYEPKKEDVSIHVADDAMMQSYIPFVAESKNKLDEALSF